MCSHAELIRSSALLPTCPLTRHQQNKNTGATQCLKEGALAPSTCWRRIVVDILIGRGRISHWLKESRKHVEHLHVEPKVLAVLALTYFSLCPAHVLRAQRLENRKADLPSRILHDEQGVECCIG
jgi:hypothetical protein